MKRIEKALLFFGALFFLAVLLFATILPSNFVRSPRSPRTGCINNLRQIDGAKQTWAMAYHKTNGDIPNWNDLQPYLGRGANGKLPVCPEGGTYTVGRLDQPPKCSISSHSLD